MRSLSAEAPPPRGRMAALRPHRHPIQIVDRYGGGNPPHDMESSISNLDKRQAPCTERNCTNDKIQSCSNFDSSPSVRPAGVFCLTITSQTSSHEIEEASGESGAGESRPSILTRTTRLSLFLSLVNGAAPPARA